MTFRLTALFASAALCLGACASSQSLSASFSDLDANTKLSEHLYTDEKFDYSDVDLTVFEGRLMLTGTLASDAARRSAVAAALELEEINQVIDEIYVGDKTGFGQGVADSRIDAQVRARLIASKKADSGRIKIAVSNGVVYLIGVARDQEALESVLEVARTSRGVNKVVSHVLYIDAPARRL